MDLPGLLAEFHNAHPAVEITLAEATTDELVEGLRTGRFDAAIVRGRPLISLPEGTGIRARLDEACAVNGFTPRIAFEAGDPEVLAQLAERGLGVASLPEAFAKARADRIRPIAITRPGLRGRLAFAWRTKGPVSPAARVLIERTRKVLTTSQ